VDLLIAATALANRLPIFTRNPDDFNALEELIEIIDVP
jgi:predicted nucleic acid-binding protein